MNSFKTFEKLTIQWITLFTLLIPLTSLFFFIFRNTAMNMSEKTITIVFHAILSKSFNFDDGKRIVIRGEEPIFVGDWKNSNVPVVIER